MSNPGGVSFQPHRIVAQRPPPMNPLCRYYRCPENYVQYDVAAPAPSSNGFFQIGPRAIGFGRYSGAQPSRQLGAELNDALNDVAVDRGTVRLPFDPAEVADNLRLIVHRRCRTRRASVRGRPTLLFHPSSLAGRRQAAFAKALSGRPSRQSISALACRNVGRRYVQASLVSVAESTRSR